MNNQIQFIKCHTRFVLILFLSLLSVALSACSFSLAADVTPPPGSEQSAPAAMPQSAPVSGPLYPLVPPNSEGGRSIFAEKCTPCHGDKGLGDGPQAAQLPNPVAAIGSPDLARGTTPARWYTIVTQGNLERFMPPFGSALTDRQRWDVVAYAFSLSAPPALVDQGKQLFQANCVRCHGDGGKGDGPDAAGLPKPPMDLTDQASIAQKSANDFFQAIRQGVAPSMPGFADKLSEDETWALAAYLRSFTFSMSGELAASADSTLVASTPEVGGGGATEISGTPVAAGAETTGSVTGKVTSEAGINLPADLQITLHAFDNMQEVMTQTTTLQADGSYAFLDVPMPSGRVYMTTVVVNQASYGSDIGIVQQGMSAIDLPITVMKTTSDASVLKADRLHLFFEFVDAKTMRVIELYILSNSSDKTLVAAAPGEPTVKFTLPQGATNLEFQDGTLGGRYVQTTDGFGDTASISPGSGSHEVLFAYTMPYDRKLELTRLMTLPVDAVVILVPEGEIKIKSSQLQDAGTRDVDNTTYHTYSGGGLAKGDSLQLSLSGSPSAGAPSLSIGSHTNLLVGISVFGVTLILAGVWLFRRTRSREPEEVGPEVPPESATPGESTETIMDAIIALDDLYRAGQLPEDAYLTRRGELKARLKELMKS